MKKFIAILASLALVASIGTCVAADEAIADEAADEAIAEEAVVEEAEEEVVVEKSNKSKFVFQPYWLAKHPVEIAL